MFDRASHTCTVPVSPAVAFASTGLSLHRITFLDLDENRAVDVPFSPESNRIRPAVTVMQFHLISVLPPGLTDASASPRTHAPARETVLTNAVWGANAATTKRDQNITFEKASRRRKSVATAAGWEN